MYTRFVIFDLDDTLSDHSYASRCGIAVLQELHPALAAQPLDRLEAIYLALLNRWHCEILEGRETEKTARPKRYREFLAAAGIAVDDSGLNQAIERYRLGYSGNRRAVPGVPALLEELKRRGMSIGVLTNHHSVAKQREKLVECGIDHLVDGLFVSVDLGLAKPDPRAFAKVLDLLRAYAGNTVMVGVSLENDIRGAISAGIRAVWFNRLRAPLPEALEVAALESFEPVDRSVAVVLGKPDLHG